MKTRTEMATRNHLCKYEAEDYRQREGKVHSLCGCNIHGYLEKYREGHCGCRVVNERTVLQNEVEEEGRN